MVAARMIMSVAFMIIRAATMIMRMAPMCMYAKNMCNKAAHMAMGTATMIMKTISMSEYRERIRWSAPPWQVCTLPQKIPWIGYCANEQGSLFSYPMCLKLVGAELPIMAGTRPQVVLHVRYDGTTVCKAPMRPDRLPAQPPLTPELKGVLALDKRKPGERRPKRLVLGTFDREPYHFYSARLPGGGLHFPDGDLCAHLNLDLWVESRHPMFHYDVLFHFKGSTPVIHPFGNRVIWVRHANWSLAQCYGALQCNREESPCGCYMRLRMCFNTGARIHQGPTQVR